MTEKPASKKRNRNFRMEESLYGPALEKARSEGVSLSDVVRRLLSQWLSQDSAKAGQEQS